MDSKIGIIYFSKNRPLQLDLAISSNRFCCGDWDNANHYVIYKADEPYKKAYETLIERHSDCKFIEETPQKFFYTSLLELLGETEFVVFNVDDVIYTNDYFISVAVGNLYNNRKAIGFSLRLGYNTTYSYASDKEMVTPDFTNIAENVLKYNWITERNNTDFGFALEVSGTVYRSRDLLFVMANTQWNNPNALELALYMNLMSFRFLPEMLCFDKSVCFSNPVNKVYTDNNNNRVGVNEKYSVENLLTKYEEGFRVPYNKFYKFLPNSCHQEVDLF